MKAIINNPRTCDIGPVFGDNTTSTFELEHWFVCGDIFNLKIKCIDGELKDMINEFEISINYDDLKYLYANLSKELWKIISRNYPIIEKEQKDNNQGVKKDDGDFSYCIYSNKKTNKVLVAIDKCEISGEFPDDDTICDMLLEHNIDCDKNTIMLAKVNESHPLSDGQYWENTYSDWIASDVVKYNKAHADTIDELAERLRSTPDLVVSEF